MAWVSIGSAAKMITIEAVNLALLDRLDQLLPEVIGGKPDRNGREWSGGKRKDGGPGDCVQVRLAGDRRGKWRWLAAGKGGDLLGLICEFKTDGDMKKALRWAIDWLGGDVPVDTEEAKLKRQKMAERVAREERRRQQSMIGWARQLYEAASPEILDSPVEHYLRDRRIELQRLPHLPGGLRFHPALRHPDLQVTFPGMIAAVRNSQGELLGVHRTFLVKREDKWDRLRDGVDGEDIDGKLTLGACVGNCIRLWDGAHWRDGERQAGWSWSGPRGMDHVRAGEGIENVLSLVMGDMAHPYVAVMSIGNFPALILPANCKRLEWWGDNDGYRDGELNKTTLAKVAEGIEVHRAAGREVAIYFPPAGRKGWNDCLLDGLPESAAAPARYWGA